MRIFRILVPAAILALLLADCLILFACYAAIPFQNSGTDLFTLNDFLSQQIIVVLCVVIPGMYLKGLYEGVWNATPTSLLQQIGGVIGILMIAQALIRYWDADLALPPAILIPGSVLAVTMLFAERLLFSLAVRKQVGARRVLFIGWSPTIDQLAGHLVAHPEVGFVPIGYLSDRPCESRALERVGPLASLEDVAVERAPAWVIVERRELIQAAALTELLQFRFEGVHAELASRLYETALGRVCIAELEPDSLLFSGSWQPDATNLAFQTLYSRLIAVVAGLLSLPVLAITYVALKLGGKEPTFTGDARIGLKSVPFTMYRLSWQDWGRDATGIARLVFRLGVDALPQFWNVLRGEMSIVGPDPERPELADRLSTAIPFYAQRHEVRPGMTGWSQIRFAESGGGENAIQRLEYDLYYVKNACPSLDFSIIVRWLKRALRFLS